jgi:hypothetical protein
LGCLITFGIRMAKSPEIFGSYHVFHVDLTLALHRLYTESAEL